MKTRWRMESKPKQRKPRQDGGCYPPPRFRDYAPCLERWPSSSIFAGIVCGTRLLRAVTHAPADGVGIVRRDVQLGQTTSSCAASAGASGESTASETTLPSTADGGRSDTAFSLGGDATSSSTGTNAACSTDASTAPSRASGAISGVMWNSESNSGAGLGLSGDGRYGSSTPTSTRSISSSRSSWDGARMLSSSQGSTKRTRCEGSACGGGVVASAPAGDRIAGGAASPSGDERGSALVSAEGSTAAAAGRRLVMSAFSPSSAPHHRVRVHPLQCPCPHPHPPRQQTTRDAHHLRPDAAR
ncbi:hypothetical protein DFH09DRAFT_1161196 [Mycena vulgaris]|nr:hypothetical protein DFH09DRAFT_1161196 [Mycena vulgaris]